MPDTVGDVYLKISLKILLEIWPSLWQGREGRIIGKIPRYTYLTLTPPYNLIG